MPSRRARRPRRCRRRGTPDGISQSAIEQDRIGGGKEEGCESGALIEPGLPEAPQREAGQGRPGDAFPQQRGRGAAGDEFDERREDNE